MINNSKIYFNGSKWETNNYGKIEIIGRGEEKGYYICKFEDGNVFSFPSKHIRTGSVKNLYHPSVYGIGYMGVGKNKSSINKKTTKEYSVWQGLFERCYSPSNIIKNQSYIDCTVDKRWHNFQNFCEDIRSLEGYTEWKNSTKSREYSLDKDKKIKGNRIYSKDTCVFITSSENSTITAITGLNYIATRLSDNYKEEFTNQTEFARKYNLHQQAINKVLRNKLKTTGGWKFEIKIS